MKVVILAGGFGTRISEESHLKPKPMIEIGERPILWHIMKIYSHYGFNDFVVCLGYKGHCIKEFFANYYMRMSDVTYDFRDHNKTIIHENVAEPWKVTLVDTGLYTNTAGRIIKVRKYLENEPFMLTYGDGVGDVDIQALLEYHRKNGRLVTLTGIQPGGRYGVLEVDEQTNAVTGFEEKAKEDGGWINGGFMVMEQGVFDYLDQESMLEQGPMQRLSRANQLRVYKHTGFWQCMDTQRDKNLLERLWQQGKAPWKVWDN
ncbi:MAG: glucose-1-phosphate cytidylyltransferase [Oscillospiraceae bacterium]|nr:glucose-1-phosphate cytidylyltransferase [Oscillospiraceae bacterium]MCI1990147.1 glucose-1-phosphate cytidylyltransferase [Oscillospiraceae bacterium]MCI2034896.1 glucose-1-phosphate cytidylyltransferase [Oscillospiraceae bacterium]